MNYKKLTDWNSGFHDWAIRRYPHGSKKQNGFMGGFIFGERGQGKSTYAYKVMAKTYYTLNGYCNYDHEVDAYKEALKYMIYEPHDFQKLTIYNKIHYIITPMACLDDASMHFGNMLHMINPKLYSALLAETATIRSAITGFLITAPKRVHVAKFLRDYDDFKGEAFIDEGPESDSRENWNRKIRFYKWTWYPDEVKYCIHIPFQDKYSCFIPDEHYYPYIKRKRYFEIKHDIDIADKISPENRYLFIENKNDLPQLEGCPDLKQIVDKWEKEQVDTEKQTKIQEIEHALKMKRLQEKIDKVKDEREKSENI